MKNSKLIYLALVFVLAFGCTVQAEEHLVSTVFFETDVRDAINELVFQTGVNIIMDETVRGIITLDLDDIPLEKALTMISLAGGFSYKKIDDFYFLGIVDPRSASFQYLTETESVKLQYISQEEARALLPPVYDNYLRSSAERDIISITAAKTLVEKFKTDVAAIDQPSRQVLIQAIVTEISQDALKEYGVNLLDFSQQGGSEAGWQGIRFSSESSQGFDTLNLGMKILDYGNLLTQLRLLESEHKAEIKANPRVLVNDRGTVNLFSGQTQHLILSGTGASSTLEAVNVGISLRVTPRILTGEELEIVIAPEVSHFVSDKYNSRTGLIVRRNEVSTSVYVQNGQTLIIAGLTLDQHADVRSHVPVLGKIPVIRWLFSSSTEKTEDRELIVFLVAEIQ
ncbi:MAG: secretin [Firmicutes bacterium]|nr:secretin [Bacillota bacterium]